MKQIELGLSYFAAKKGHVHILEYLKENDLLDLTPSEKLQIKSPI